MNIPKPKIDYLNKEAFRLVGIVKNFDATEFFKDKTDKTNSNLEGSLGQKKVVDWTDKVVKDQPMRSYTSLLGGNEKVAVRESLNGRCYGFDEPEYKDFKKFVHTIFNIKAIQSHISYEFIDEKAMFWIFDTYFKGQALKDFWNYFFDEMNDVIKEYKVYFPILYLDIISPVKIGNVQLEYFTKEQLDELSRRFNKKDDNLENNLIEVLFREKFQGQVFASYKLKAENKRAREIALEECSLSIDILKVCSPTTMIPNYQLSFDIDRRTKENLQNNILVQELNAPYDFHFTMYRIPNQFNITKKTWVDLSNTGLETFHTFLIERDKFDCELSGLIINAIKIYAKTISIEDLNERIVTLFTIFESLLLKDESVGIIDSVCRYASKLIFKTVEDRKYLIDLIKEMYKLRSAMVHHARKQTVDMEKLSKLQLSIVMLLCNLIQKLETHTTKKSLLDEIDLEILKAY